MGRSDDASSLEARCVATASRENAHAGRKATSHSPLRINEKESLHIRASGVQGAKGALRTKDFFTAQRTMTDFWPRGLLTRPLVLHRCTGYS